MARRMNKALVPFKNKIEWLLQVLYRTFAFTLIIILKEATWVIDFLKFSAGNINFLFPNLLIFI